MRNDLLRLAFRAFWPALLALIGLGLLLGLAHHGDAQQPIVTPKLKPLPIPKVRGVTYIQDRPLAAYAPDLENALPAIQAAGFNTVWVVTPWHEFEPSPLARPPKYDRTTFTALEQILSDLGRRRMRAIVALNYLGKGWAPRGIDPCRLLTNRKMEHAFEQYVAGFLTRIRRFHTIVYVMLFTEPEQVCQSKPYDQADELSAQLRTTLGSLPSRLPPQLRSQFEIGYHDNSLIDLGWANGASPIASPDPFDFLSMSVYGLESDSDAQIAADLDQRVQRFRAVDPGAPLLIGEFGASRCHGSSANQARVETAIARYAIQHEIGFNVWHWRPVSGEDSCRIKSSLGLSITGSNGKLNIAGRALRRLLTRDGR